jgi:flagellar motor switch/type III secretory pathway protein FliN
MAESELARLEQAEQAVEVKNRAAQISQPPPPMSRIEEHASWPMLSQLRLAMTASVVLKGFKVRDLLKLRPGQVVESVWPETEDVPLIIGQVQVAWSEFEVVEQRLVVRLTRLA